MPCTYNYICTAYSLSVDIEGNRPNVCRWCPLHFYIKLCLCVEFVKCERYWLCRVQYAQAVSATSSVIIYWYINILELCMSLICIICDMIWIWQMLDTSMLIVQTGANRAHLSLKDGKRRKDYISVCVCVGNFERCTYFNRFCSSCDVRRALMSDDSIFHDKSEPCKICSEHILISVLHMAMKWPMWRTILLNKSMKSLRCIGCNYDPIVK